MRKICGSIIHIFCEFENPFTLSATNVSIENNARNNDGVYILDTQKRRGEREIDLAHFLVNFVDFFLVNKRDLAYN